MKPFKDFVDKLMTTSKVDTSLSQIKKMIESNHAKAHISNTRNPTDVEYVANVIHDPKNNRYKVTVTKNGRPFTASSQVHLTTGDYSPQKFTAAVIKLHHEFHKTPEHKIPPRREYNTVKRPANFTATNDRFTITSWGGVKK